MLTVNQENGGLQIKVSPNGDGEKFNGKVRIPIEIVFRDTHGDSSLGWAIVWENGKPVIVSCPTCGVRGNEGEVRAFNS